MNKRNLLCLLAVLIFLLIGWVTRAYSTDTVSIYSSEAIQGHLDLSPWDLKME